MASPIEDTSFPYDRDGKLFFKSEYIGIISVPANSTHNNIISLILSEYGGDYSSCHLRKIMEFLPRTHTKSRFTAVLEGDVQSLLEINFF